MGTTAWHLSRVAARRDTDTPKLTTSVTAPSVRAHIAYQARCMHRNFGSNPEAPGAGAAASATDSSWATHELRDSAALVAFAR